MNYIKSVCVNNKYWYRVTDTGYTTITELDKDGSIGTVSIVLNKNSREIQAFERIAELENLIYESGNKQLASLADIQHKCDEECSATEEINNVL
jgi:hypothetical protein